MVDSSAHIVISGLVQGVGFRYFASRKADELGVTGYVRNLPDGRVEIVACGERGQIADLLTLLRIGPRASSVKKVDIEWVATTETYDRFEIR